MALSVATQPAALTPLAPASPRSLINVAVLGDPGVGKTALLTRFVRQRFDGRRRPTVCPDFVQTDTTAPDGRGSSVIFRDMARDGCDSLGGRAHVRRCDVAVVVFDLTDTTSFQHITAWCAEASAAAEGPEPPVLLIGTKRDLIARRAVPRVTAEQLATELRVPYFEVSAKFDEDADRAADDNVGGRGAWAPVAAAVDKALELAAAHQQQNQPMAVIPGRR